MFGWDGWGMSLPLILLLHVDSPSELGGWEKENSNINNVGPES